MGYDSKVNEMVNRLRKMFTGCFVCGKRIDYPFKTTGFNDKVIRCKEHQKVYRKFWFERYVDYIKTFNGQT